MAGLQRVKRELSRLHDAIYYRFTFNAKKKSQLTELFTRLYFDSHLAGETFLDTSWLGVPTYKCPTDLWVYQELLFELRPEIIIETGTLFGGSAYYLASLCDLIYSGRIITIDIDDAPKGHPRQKATVSRVRPSHSRITYLLGSSISGAVLNKVRELTRGVEKILVILDSDHSRDHVLAELRAYAPLVSVGSYVIVEDTIANGHPVLPRFGPGPMEAAEEFLKENHNFTTDRSMEKHLLTFNPRGYLKKIRSDS
jgi:cephalosporin hydroxylase